MKSGLNLVLDEHGNLYPVLLLSKCCREPASNGGYVHKNKLYMRKPYCKRCEDYDELYKDVVMDMTFAGEWIISVAIGEANYKNGLISTLLKEDEYMLLPIITETKGEAIEHILGMINDIADVENGNTVTLCETLGDVVFRVDRHDDDPVYIGARALYDENIEDDDDFDYLFAEIKEAFEDGGLSCIELEDTAGDEECSCGICHECGRVDDEYEDDEWDDDEWDDDDDEWDDDDNDDDCEGDIGSCGNPCCERCACVECDDMDC